MTKRNSKRILVLDDDPQMRDALSLLLKGEGYDVVCAMVGHEAVSLYRENPFDLVIIELLLATNDGFDTFVKLHCTSVPPKIIATAKSSRVDVTAYLKIAKRLGADATLAKPFSAEELITAIRDLFK